MCGRYALHANPEVVALQFGLEAMPEFKARYNVCPGTPILAVRADRAGRRRAEPQPNDARLFGLAGIVALWQGERSVVLITTEPNDLMASIHDRMPVIIPPAEYAAWLDPQNADAQALLRPYPAGSMNAHVVHPRVNTPANDDAGLVTPFDAQPVLDILPVHGRTHRTPD